MARCGGDDDADDDGRPDTLRLLFATPRAWLQDGQRIRVERAPTAFGEVSLDIESHLATGTVTAKVSLPARARPAHTLLRIRLPDGWVVTAANTRSGTGLNVDRAGTTDLTALNGEQEITYTAADPAPGWRAQLEALELLAHRKHRRAFAALTVAQRRDLIRPQLPRGRNLRLPSNIVSAPHVAIALMAHWAATSAATDLAYGVVIGKDQCRNLADSARRPLPLAREPR